MEAGKNFSTISTFASDENGAITVDWVVITSAVVGLGMATTLVVSGGVENLAEDTRNALANISVGVTFGQEEDGGGFMLTAETLTSWHHNESWFNATTTNYSDPNQWSAEQLVAQHEAMAEIILSANPNDIQSGHYQNAIDHMGAIEIGMAAQGVSVPDSGVDFQTAYESFHGS
ncbi:hypothetical protein HKCCSP123_09655 [Rhodobacterales bacterium HKCCSP123]|nr:hypothetical protein [Rhodobacterales bacterium HKCCSP123]